jgi:hypothetical protein
MANFQKNQKLLQLKEFWATSCQVSVNQVMGQDAVFNPEYEKATADKLAVDIFYRLAHERETITADDYVREARRAKMNPVHISRTCGPLFKSFRANGTLRKTSEYRISERSSKPLPVYVCLKEKPL